MSRHLATNRRHLKRRRSISNKSQQLFDWRRVAKVIKSSMDVPYYSNFVAAAAVTALTFVSLGWLLG